MTMKLINIPPKVQRKGKLCWAACIEMILNTYPNPQNTLISQKEICIERNNEELPLNEERITILSQSTHYIRTSFCLKENNISEKNFFTFKHNIDSYKEILGHFGVFSQEVEIGIEGFVSIDDITKQINNNQSLIISGIHIPVINLHAILIIGYSKGSNFQIAINDPYIYYNYPTETFTACNLSIHGGRACFIYQNLYHYNAVMNDGYLKKILTVSNFSISNLPAISFSSFNVLPFLNFTLLKDAITAFDIHFLESIFGFTPNLIIYPSVVVHSIFYYGNGNNYSVGIMLMPIFSHSNDQNVHLLEFIYDLQSRDGSKLYTPICIRQPYFNGYLKVYKVALPNGEQLFFDHETPNYSLVNIPSYGYNFISFEDLNGVKYITPIETYTNLHMFFEVAYSMNTFNNIVNTLNLEN
jgi:hypothetical protein